MCDVDRLVVSCRGPAPFDPPSRLEERSQVAKIVDSDARQTLEQSESGSHPRCRRLPPATARPGGVTSLGWVAHGSGSKSNKIVAGLAAVRLAAMIRQPPAQKSRTRPSSRIRISTTAVPAEHQSDFHGTALRAVPRCAATLAAGAAWDVSWYGLVRTHSICVAAEIDGRPCLCAGLV